MHSFAPVRSRLILLGSIIAAALLFLWLGWRLMLGSSSAAIICFWAALVCALGAGVCLFSTFVALDTFRSLANACSTCDDRRSNLKLILSLGVLLVTSLVVISLWGAHFTLNADNLLVALAFATNSSIALTASSLYNAIPLSTCQKAKG